LAHDVFISYTTRDKPIADAVCHALEARHIRCWIAPRDVAAGLSWKAAIVGAIRDSQVMVLIFSGEVNSSKDVRREVDIAFEERRPIIPFRIEDVAPSDELYYCIADRHWLDALTPPVEQHIERLVAALRRFVVEPESVPAPVPIVMDAPIVTDAPSDFAVAAQPGAAVDDSAPDPVRDIEFGRDEQARPLAAMTRGRIAIAAAALVALTMIGVWARGAPDATERRTSGVDIYDAGRHAEAVPLLTSEAEAGSVDAQARLAEAYVEGRGVAKDVTLGLSFLTRAANGGDAAAQSRLAFLYEQGTGVSKDVREAMRWHSSAADKGIVSSQCAAALLAVSAEGGVARNHAAAAKWFAAAAKSGAACGQLGYGFLHYNGYGVQKNYDEAMRLWEAAAAKGDPTAKDNILKVQADWVLPPVFAGAWSPVLGEERRAEIARVKATSMGSALRGAIFQRMRKLPVDFYEDAAIIEIEIAVGAEPPGVLAYVRLPELIVPMTGKNDQFAALNGISSRLDTPARASQAMRLLITSVQSDQGRYQLLEHVSPLAVSGSQTDGWIGNGVLQAGTTVVAAEFGLTSAGAMSLKFAGLPEAPPPADAERFDGKGLRRRVRPN